MVAGHLLSHGIRVPHARLGASIHRVDPEGVAKRSTAIKRRVYNISRLNEVWHIDGNHKLIRWWLVVHGGIDVLLLFSNGSCKVWFNCQRLH